MFGAIGAAAGLGGMLLGGLGARARRGAEGATNEALERGYRDYSRRLGLLRDTEQQGLDGFRGEFDTAQRGYLSRLGGQLPALQQARMAAAPAQASAMQDWRSFAPRGVQDPNASADPYSAVQARELAGLRVPGMALQGFRRADLSRPAYDLQTQGGLQGALADLARRRGELGRGLDIERARAEGKLGTLGLAYQSAMNRAGREGESTRQVGGFLSGLGGTLLGGSIGGLF